MVGVFCVARVIEIAEKTTEKLLKG